MDRQEQALGSGSAMVLVYVMMAGWGFVLGLGAGLVVGWLLWG